MHTLGSANRLTSALVDYFRDAQSAGSGSLEFAALYELMKADRAG